MVKKFMLLMGALFAISCSSSKIEMFPDSKISYASGDKLVITRLEGIKTFYANDFYDDAYSLFVSHPGLEVIDESDMIYELKTQGLNLPAYDSYSKEELAQIQEKSSLDFVLTSKVMEMTDAIGDKATRQATIAFKLYDLRAKIPTVVLNIKTTMPPLTYVDNQGVPYQANVNSSTNAAQKAYKKAIKKFYKAFECC